VTTKIEKVWETPAQFKTPESVIYEPNEDVLFVSNIDGAPDRKDKQGAISKVSPLNGSIIELNWVTGLDAPKGMAITNNTNNTLLYVSDITETVQNSASPCFSIETLRITIPVVTIPMMELS
jgi:hypothetical protein